MGILSLQIALGTPLTGPQGAFQKMESHIRGFSWRNHISANVQEMGVWQGLQNWPSALALLSLVCLPRRGTFSAVQKPLTRGRGSCVPSWDPGCNESWMKWAQDRASGLSRELGTGRKGKQQLCYCSAGLIQSRFLCGECMRGMGAGDRDCLPPALRSLQPGLAFGPGE